MMGISLPNVEHTEEGVSIIKTFSSLVKRSRQHGHFQREQTGLTVLHAEVASGQPLFTMTAGWAVNAPR